MGHLASGGVLTSTIWILLKAVVLGPSIVNVAAPTRLRVHLKGIEPERDGFGATHNHHERWTWHPPHELALSQALGFIRVSADCHAYGCCDLT